MQFYFAWVAKTETTFDPDTHAREDEELYALQMTHAEGDFAALDIDLINPSVGLLAPSRKQWAWLSYRKDDNTLVPLFFGRLVGVPQSMSDTVARLSFVARPVDFDEQKVALADSMRVSPYYDPIWLSDDDLTDPDKVLEGYPRLWHIDRLTGLVTASDIITGEDGQVDFTADQVFYDNLSVSYSETPARRCLVTASVKWSQAGAGGFDITPQLLQEFASGTATASIINIKGDPQPSAGMLNIVAGDDMITNWPKPGTSIGGGWAVGNSSAQLVGPPPLPPILAGQFDSSYQIVHEWDTWPFLSSAMRTSLQIIFDRSPGFVVQVIDHNDIKNDHVLGHDIIEVLWIPVWRVAPHMEITWDTSRSRGEDAIFEIDADVQPLLADPGDEEVISISIGPADVDLVMDSVTQPRYFATDRGLESLESVIMRARAALLSRARAVDVQFDADFDIVATLSCRMSASVFDKRIPGGVAAGKVKSYTLTVDGDSGTLNASVVIGCSVGRDGSISPQSGTPEYVATGYVNEGYQLYDGVVVVPTDDGSIGYTVDPAYPMDDDGMVFDHVVAADWLDHIEYTGSLDTHQDQLNVFTGFPVGTVETIDRADNFSTQVQVFLRPISTRAFQTTVVPVLTTLKIPRTIDLEAEETT